MLTGPKWKAALYLDERATKEQSDSLTKIFSGQAGGFFAMLPSFIGEMLGVKSASIEFGIMEDVVGSISKILWNLR